MSEAGVMLAVTFKALSVLLIRKDFSVSRSNFRTAIIYVSAMIWSFDLKFEIYV